jgi:hypothetical protein
MTAHLHIPHIPHATAVRIGDYLDALSGWLVAVAFIGLVAATVVVAVVSGAVVFLSLLDLAGSHR